MAERTEGLLFRAAPTVVGDAGLKLLDAARSASSRVGDPDDAEGLHDFRVALRRLRTLLRGFRRELGGAISKKLQRSIRDVARATSAGRDAEVQLTWIRDQRAALPKQRAAGVPWLIARLEDRRARGYVTAREAITQQFSRLERRLRRALNAILLDPHAGSAPFAPAVARLIREHTAALEQELAAAHSASDDAAIHASRIAVKRLRYLLEPMADDAPRARTALAGLREMQDLLGDLHDLQVLLADLGDAAADAAAERARRLHQAALHGDAAPVRRKRAGPRAGSAGLLALTRRARLVQDELFQRVEKQRAGGPVGALTRDLRTLADELATLATPPAPLPPPRRTRVLRRREPA